MPSAGLIIVGGGGHATVVAEAAALSERALVGYFDDSESPALDAWAAALRSAGPRWAAVRPARLVRLEEAPGFIAAAEAGRFEWILGIGDLALRRAIVQRLADAPAAALPVVHPDASISPTAALGRGVFVGPRAVVHPRARVEAHAIINSGAIVEHDCIVGENAHLAPGAVLGGGAVVGPDALVGIGSRILPTLSIGRGAVVGAGAVVVRDVAPGEVVVGVPARPLSG
jgi:sugar O-acyltransferase (sialic acid O-acetyltransferase NeuD family)